MPSVKDTSQTQSNIKYVRARIRGGRAEHRTLISRICLICVCARARARALVYVYRVACGTGATDGGGGGVAVTAVDLNLKLALRSAELGYASKYLPLPLQCFFFRLRVWVEYRWCVFINFRSHSMCRTHICHSNTHTHTHAAGARAHSAVRVTYEIRISRCVIARKPFPLRQRRLQFGHGLAAAPHGECRISLLLFGSNYTGV